ncbi:hypothetical protein V6N11_024710 [Hibiscus sabdariffa]|uniref:LOB domain-containing protein n=1 Tax=Hibiscus sabdariffa TaxID=183260 RepID=A0ABR2QNC5_9ROSI
MTGSGSPCGACKFLRRKCVVNLQAQLASLKELQAAQSAVNASVTANPNDRYHGKLHNLEGVQSWFQPDGSSMAPNFSPNSYGLLDPTSYSGSSSGSEDYVSFTTAFEEAPHPMSAFDMQTNNRQWSHCQDVVVDDDLQAMAFGYAQYS